MSGDFGCNIAALQKPTKMGTEHFKGDSFRILSSTSDRVGDPYSFAIGCLV